MAKSIEQKAAEALSHGLSNELWSPHLFAQHIQNQHLVVQWKFLRTIFVLVKAWRARKETGSEWENFSDYIDADPDMVETEEAVDLARWDT